jgi:hypothetical protein
MRKILLAVEEVGTDPFVTHPGPFPMQAVSALISQGIRAGAGPSRQRRGLTGE